MLVIVSDIHVTDESTAINVDPSAFRLLGREIATSAEDRGAAEIHVVLLGDILDLVRSSYWMSHGVAPADRPWGGDLDPTTGMNRNAAAVESQFQHVLDGILGTASGKALIGMLEELPRIDGKRPSVTYVVGNHDRVFHNFPSLQATVASALPSVDVSFADHVRLPEYGLLARHGHEWDENCYGWHLLTHVLQKGSKVGQFDPEASRVMAIGEPITAELMGGLIFYVESSLDLGSAEDKRFLDNLKDVNNLRPMEQALSWVNWFTKGRSDRYTAIVREALIQALDSLLECSLAKRWDELKPDLIVSGDITDYLAKARSAVKKSKSLQDLGDLITTVTKVASVVHGVFGSKLDDLEKGAKQEFARTPVPDFQYVVYGHTHVGLHDDFSAGQLGGVKLYINTGTYLPLVERALEEGFVRSHRMTLLFFYNQAEDVEDRADSGPTVDLWLGMRRKTFV